MVSDAATPVVNRFVKVLVIDDRERATVNDGIPVREHSLTASSGCCFSLERTARVRLNDTRNLSYLLSDTLDVGFETMCRIGRGVLLVDNLRHKAVIKLFY